MPRGLIQYATDAKIRRQERFKAAQQAAFDRYVDSYIKSAIKQRFECKSCEMKVVRAVKVCRYIDCIVITWKCDHCGHEVETEITTQELIDCFNADKRQQAISA